MKTEIYNKELMASLIDAAKMFDNADLPLYGRSGAIVDGDGNLKVIPLDEMLKDDTGKSLREMVLGKRYG